MIKKFVLGALVAAVTVMAQAPAAKSPQVKSKPEQEALQAVFSAPDVDGRVKAGEDFVTKYPDSEFKSTVLAVMADTCGQRGDATRAQVYGERAIEADPKNYMAMMTLARSVAQSTKEFDLDREEKLGKAEKYAKQAMELVGAAAKPNPALTDEQWNQAKGMFTAQAHEVLGICGLVRKNYDAAITEFQASLAATNPPEPSTQVRLANAYTQTKKYDDAVALLDKVIAGMPAGDPNADTIKRVAENEKKRALALKARDAKAAAPAAPAAEAPKP